MDLPPLDHARRRATPRAGAALALALAAVSFVAPRPAAAQLADAVGSADGSCNTFGTIVMNDYTTGETIASQMCDSAIQNGTQFGQSIVRTSTVFAATPFIDVSTAASKSATGAFVIANGSVRLQYETQIAATQPPPFVPPEVPVIVRAPYAMTDDFGDSPSSGNVTLRITQVSADIFFAETREMNVVPDEGTFVVSGGVEPGEPIQVEMEAVCSSTAPADGAAECRIVMDPTFEFDQPAFDALYGVNSFVLADYAAFEQSGNLVPEPGAVVSLIVGSIALAAGGRRTGRAPSNGRLFSGGTLVVRNVDIGGGESAAGIAYPPPTRPGSDPRTTPASSS